VSLALFILIPHGANAFWPLFTTQAAGAPSPLLHDSSFPLLVAAANVDPSSDSANNQLITSQDSALIDTTGVDGAYPNPSDVATVPTNATGAITTYVVKDGDTLSGIASKFNVSMNTVLWANDIKDSKLVRPGISLTILPVTGIRHSIAKGETLSSLANKYAADANDIAAFNGLDATAPLTKGDDIIIPGGELPVSKTRASNASQNATTTKGSGKTSAKNLASAKSSIRTGGSLSQIQANPYKGGSGSAINGYYGNPVPGGLITQGIHGWNGIDIAAPNGTPIYAAAAGSVIISKVGGWNGGYGNYVVISHDNGTQTLYSHLSSDAVSIGQNVSAGERIGGVGISGEATGYHLHFEVRGAKNPFADCEVGTRCDPE
jgi:murein DD-endopeptidase MepM/ murein hydrolase activator NlpD